MPQAFPASRILPRVFVSLAGGQDFGSLGQCGSVWEAGATRQGRGHVQGVLAALHSGLLFKTATLNPKSNPCAAS